MSEPGSTETESRKGRSTALWVGALVLAAAATAVLVLSDDARLLRLGLVAALWSALIGAFAVAKLRHRVTEGEQLAAERQRTYELELEREITARREFELEAEAEARRQATEQADGELHALKAELRRLRESLEQVVGGDVLFERVALRAESTRVRSLPEPGDGRGEDSQYIQQRPPTGRELPPVQQPVAVQRPAAVAQPNTELIAKLSGEQPERRPKPRPRPKPQQPQAHPSRPSMARRPDRTAYEQPRRAPEQPAPPEATPEPPAAPVPDPAGAHAEGTSVNDLLAAYGNTPEVQRRHRRRA